MYNKNNGNIKIRMFSRNSIYPLRLIELFPHISMMTMATFLGTFLIAKKTNWVE